MTPADWYIKPLLEQAIDLNRKLFRHIEPYAEQCSSDLSKFLRDFRTIRIDIGQRSGKTTAIIDLADPDDAIVVLGAGALGDVAIRLRDHDKNVAMYKVSATSRPAPVPKRHSIIWVDAASFMPQTFLRDMYDAFGHDRNQLFVLLG